MIAVQLDGEDYLVVIGGKGPSDNNTPEQPGAQYSYGYCNEIHYYKLSSGQCVYVCVLMLVYWSRRMYMRGRELSTFVVILSLPSRRHYQRGYSSRPVCMCVSE